MTDKQTRAMLAAMWAVAVAAALVLNGVNLFRGALNQDEGWYLYGARLVAEGRQPYVDFATTQGPVMSYAYAFAYPLVAAWGVAGGRLFTTLLGFAAALAAAWLAARLARRVERAGDGGPDRGPAFAALTAFVLIAVNVHQSYFCTIVKTYALTALLLVAGLLALSYAEGRRRLPLGLLAGVLVTMAAATRLSAAFVLPAAFLVLLARRRGLLAWAFFGGAVVAVLWLYVPFLVRAPRALWFALVEYHGGREAGGLMQAAAYKVGFVSRVLLAYTAAASLALVLAVYAWLQRPPAARPAPLLPVLWVATGLVTLVHLLAPFPYDDYQVMIYPLFAVALAVSLARYGARLWAVAAVFLVCLAAALASPINQTWFIGERDRIWWPLREAAPLRVLRETAARIEAIPGVGADDLLLTQDPYLAVETGLRLPRGLELGQFAYFPDWERERAEACHVLNAAMLRELLAACAAPVAAFSGYGLAIRSPEVLPLTPAEQDALWAIVEARYRPYAEVAPFGQADTRLRILVARDARPGLEATPAPE